MQEMFLTSLLLLQIGCNRCRCRNGIVSCTRYDCDDDDEEDDGEDDVGDDPDDLEEDRNCRRCAFMRSDPVCGNDGRTYPSRCFAVNCRGLDDADVVDGPCSRRVNSIEKLTTIGSRSDSMFLTRISVRNFLVMMASSASGLEA